MTILNPTDAAKAIIPPGPQHVLQLLNPDGTPAGRAGAGMVGLIVTLAQSIPA